MRSSETPGAHRRDHPLTPVDRPLGIRAVRYHRLAWALLAIALLVSLPLAQPARAASPQPPTPAPRTCAERYPADGPGGVDLQLGCIAAELVATLSGSGRPAAKARISEWLLPIGGILGGVLLVAWLIRALNGRLNRRTAPAEPATWWVCPSCRSLSPGPSTSCYACGTPRSPGAVTIDSSTGRLHAPSPPASSARMPEDPPGS